MSDPKELEAKLQHIRAGIEKACAGVEEAGSALQNIRPYLRDLIVGEVPEARAAMITSAWQALDMIEKDLQKLDELRVALLQDLSRQSG